MSERAKSVPKARLIAFYAIIVIVAVVVVVVVANKGSGETAQPTIAGGYNATALNACLGTVPPPPGGASLPSSAPAQAAATGPQFNLLQSGQFVNVTNNQGTLGGTLRLHPGKVAGGGLRLDGTVHCLDGASQHLDAVIVRGTYALSPRSTCFGGTIILSGGGSSYQLSAGSKKLGAVSYSPKR